MRAVIYWNFIAGLLIIGCKAPVGGSQGELVQPPWLDVKITFDQLPSVWKPAEVVLDITVTGAGSDLYVGPQGDTLNLLYMKIVTSDWVTSLNVDADTLWQGKIAVGDRIVLKPVFQVDSTLLPVDTFVTDLAIPANGDTATPIWSWIDLWATFHSTTFPEMSTDSLFSLWHNSYMLFYDYRTGEYTIDTD